MKVYQTNEIRNLALVGGARSGKTTLAESLLFNGGVINRRGTVDDKNTASDYKDIELERQNSVYSSLLYTEYKNKKVNIIDTPGFDDFVGEVISSLRVADAALLVVNGQNGVEVGTEITWRNLIKTETPTVIAINQIEHEKTNFDEVIQSIKNNLSKKAILVQYPVNPGMGFDSIIDLLKMKMYKFSGDTGKSEELDVPANLKGKAEELQAELIEAAAEGDESLMEKFFAEGTLSPEDIENGIKLGIKNRNLYPVLCISAKQNVAISNLLDFVVNSVPAPEEVKPLKSTDGKDIKIDPKGKVSLYVYKTSVEPHLGEVSYFKVISGKITEGFDLINMSNDNKERFTQLFIIAGKNRTKINEVVAGDIAATIKLKDTRTNDTLSEKGYNVIVEKTTFPEPKYRTAVKAVESTDDEKVSEILFQMAKEDPTLLVGHSKELRQLIVQGQGELHLAIVKWYFNNVYKIAIDYIAPKIPYRETITKSARANYRHKKQSGGSGQFGEVHLMIEPYEESRPYNTPEFSVRGKELIDMPWGGKLEYVNCIVGGSIDARFIPAILKGIMEKMDEGPLTGSYARDIRVYIYDGKMHPVDSNEISFKLAGRNAFSEAFKNAGPKILEPIYNVEVYVPEEKMGDVMTDLQGRRAMIMGMESEGSYQKIRARVPLAELNKYSTALSSITSGRATYTMKYDEYQQVPSDIQTQLLKTYEEGQKEE